MTRIKRQGIVEKLKGTHARDLFTRLYGEKNIDKQVDRYIRLIDNFYKCFTDTADEAQLFSSPGRTELGGNHTDHNHGRVIAAAVNFDSIAAVNRTDDNTITLYSEGYEGVFRVELASLEVDKSEQETTNALIRGIAARFKQLGYNIGGFNAYVSSNVLGGSGLSSSASIEILIGAILSGLYNDNKVGAKELAMIGQYAENVYFNKPCGLMDQMACAVGGLVSIDFKNEGKPFVRKIDFDLDKVGYSLLVVDTGGSHADLTEDYANIPQEMKKVASSLGKDVLREVEDKDLIKNIKSLREKVGDRAILRAIHFLSEDRRAKEQFMALQEGRFEDFLRMVKESADSSWKYLQNVYTNQRPEEQGLTLALALTEGFIKKKGYGACRVHGGGFAGTIQAYIKIEQVEEYRAFIEEVFGENSATVLSFRPYGSLYLNPLLG